MKARKQQQEQKQVLFEDDNQKGEKQQQEQRQVLFEDDNQKGKGKSNVSLNGGRLVDVAKVDSGGKKPGGVLGDLVKAESMFQLALALPAGCFIGWGIGTLLDKHFHTGWMMVVGLLLGAAGGFAQIFMVAKRFLNKDGE
jgi:hypothetical protein